MRKFNSIYKCLIEKVSLENVEYQSKLVKYFIYEFHYSIFKHIFIKENSFFVIIKFHKRKKKA